MIIATVPSYLAIADLGFGSALGVELGKLWAADRCAEAAEIYEAGWTAVLSSCIVFAVAFSTFVRFVPIGRWLHLTAIGATETRSLLYLFMVQVLVAQLTGVLRAVFRTHGLNSRGIMLANATTLGMFLSVLATAVLHGSPKMLALCNDGVALIGISLMWSQGRRYVPWLRPRLRKFDWPTIRPLVTSGSGLTLLGVGYLFSIQGTLLAISAATGPQVALLFSATRTLTRLVNQLTNMVESTFVPEFSTAIGASDHQLARRLHHRASQISLWVALLSSLAMLLAAKPLFYLYTRHRLPFDGPLFGLLLLAMVINGGYYGSIAAPIAENRTLGLALYFCGGAALSVGISALGSIFWGATGAAIGVVALETLMLVVVVPMAMRIVGDDYGEWLRATLIPDFRWLRTRRSA